MPDDLPPVTEHSIWVVPVSSDKDEPYATGLELEEAGKKLIEATLKDDGVDYKLERVEK